MQITTEFYSPKGAKANQLHNRNNNKKNLLQQNVGRASAAAPSRQLSTPGWFPSPQRTSCWLHPHDWPRVRRLSLIQMSVVVGTYVHIPATPQHLSQRCGLLHSVLGEQGWDGAWGQNVLVKTLIHFLLVIFGCSLQVGVIFRVSLPVSSRNPVFCLSWKHRSRCYCFFTLSPRAQFQVLFGIRKMEMLPMWLPPWEAQWRQEAWLQKLA